MSLGLRDLFTFDDIRLRLAAGDSVAALLWWIAGNAFTVVTARLFGK